LASRLQFLMKSRRSTSTMSAFLGFILTDVTVYPAAVPLFNRAIVKALREHLGVFYRHFLEYDQNHIIIKWMDEDRDKSGGPVKIHPIFPEFVENDPEPVKEELRSVVGDVQYHRGAINWEKTRRKYDNLGFDIIGTSDDDSPFRVYYRKNKSTQGVNVVYNGRTIDTGAIERIWDNAVGLGEREDEDRGTIAAHSRYNDFAGEIIITDNRFETVNNKIGMNPDSERWQEVKDKLNESERYHPIKRGRKQREDTYATRLMKNHENDTTTKESYRESGEWGVSIDVLQLLETGEEQIYELKSGSARPQDVYQLIMYWDAYERADEGNEDLNKGILVAEKITGNAKQFLRYWDDERKSASNNEYNLEFKTLDQLGISDETYTEIE
jgi:hypothetical protein